jgi:S-sulfo-L-cysteine synthase (O-acetyl-L-serine-dependent)
MEMISAGIDTGLIRDVEAIAPLVGNTPLFPIRHLLRKPGVRLFAKLEWQQLGGSVKSRPAFNIIRRAVTDGLLTRDRILLDASSGNTGIAYAAIGAALGLKVSICIPENASEERKLLLRMYGAEVILTSRFGSTDEAQQIARQLHAEYPERYFYADQYNNEANWRAHYRSTGAEVYRQTGGGITHFVAGLGTTGTFTGTGRRLKEVNPDIRLIALQPDSALHGLEGWKHLETAVVPGIYDPGLADEQHPVDTFEAYDLIREAARFEGLMLSPSSAANLAGALKVAGKLEEGIVVTVFADNAEKYGEVIRSLI